VNKDGNIYLIKLAAISFVIAIISFPVWDSEKMERLENEECVEVAHEDYGAAPSHYTRSVCTLPKKTILHHISAIVLTLSSFSTCLFAGTAAHLHFEKSAIIARKKELEHRERIILGTEKRAKKFEKEKDYFSAIAAWRELNMEEEARKVMAKQARDLEKHKDYNFAILIWRELNKEEEARKVMANQARDLEKHKDYNSAISIWRELNKEEEVNNVLEKKAYEREKARDYESAIEIWESLGEIEEAARARKEQAEMGSVKVAQNVVHGDYVDDRVTIVKDSVLNRSNVGGSYKMQELEKLTQMKKEGLIDDDEFKQMKKEILGK